MNSFNFVRKKKMVCIPYVSHHYHTLCFFMMHIIYMFGSPYGLLQCNENMHYTWHSKDNPIVNWSIFDNSLSTNVNAKPILFTKMVVYLSMYIFLFWWLKKCFSIMIIYEMHKTYALIFNETNMNTIYSKLHEWSYSSL